jgi:hypothetical protein
MNDLLLNTLARTRLAELRHEAAQARLARRVRLVRRVVRPLLPRQRTTSVGSKRSRTTRR